MPRKILALIGLFTFTLILAACTAAPSEPTLTPLPTPSPTPAGPQTLNICTGTEPQSLYLYGDQSTAAQTLRQAIYDGPFDSQNYQSVGVLFENTPSLSNGGARIESVTVQAGDLVVDAEGQVRPLAPGTRLRPAGCRTADCAVTYTGGEFTIDQLVVTFALLPGLSWSDGAPLLASDSVYSFQLDAHPETPTDKSKIEHTASYQALDERTLEWRGLPGYLDPDYPRNFWTPLPQHEWGALSAAELLTAEASTRQPLGWGPYMIEDWLPGERLSLSRNPNYLHTPEGLPYFSQLNILFVGQGPQSNIQALLDGNCDLLLPSTAVDAEAPRLIELGEQGQAQLVFGPSGSWQHLDFGIQPLIYDDGYNPANERPDYFGQPAMRTAIAQCVDRQALVDALAWGRGALPNSYLPPDHALYNAGLPTYGFDPAAANAVLDALGWALGADGLRVAQNVENIPAGTLLKFRLTTSDEEENLATARIIQDSLDDCGIGVEIISGAPEQVFTPGLQGPLFGRNFDLALFSWPLTEQPACFLYLSEAIPGEDTNLFPYAWGGWNLSGWRNTEFDAACQAAARALPGESVYTEQHAAAQAIFAAELPALPLYLPQRIAAARPDFCGFGLEAGANPLQNIENFGFAEWCQ